MVPDRLRKPLLFGLFGGGGAFLAALVLGELLFRLLSPAAAKPAPPKRIDVDVVFVVDITGSMRAPIAGVENGIVEFVNQLESNGLAARAGLVVFGDPDAIPGEPARMTDPPFTSDIAEFKQRVGMLKGNLVDGGDAPEASWRGLFAASYAPFNPAATKIVVLVTDASANNPAQLAPAGEALRAAGVTQFHLVCDNPAWYADVRHAVPGRDFSLRQLAGGDRELNSVLPTLSREIVAQVKPLMSEVAVDRRDSGWVVAALAAWTGVMAMGLGLALVAGQNFYLRAPLLTGRQALFGGVGSLVAGLVAGVLIVLPLLALPAHWTVALIFVRAVLWAVLGGLVGLGVTPFIRNLKAALGVVGGALGGFVGGVGYMLVATLGGEMLGRLFGAMLIGFGIGTMIAIVEAAIRAAWVELRYGPKDVITVNLGPTPLVVGADRERCNLHVKKAEPVAVKAWLEGGRVMAEHVAAGVPAQSVKDGQSYPVGTATLTIRTAAQAAVAPSQPRAQRPPPPQQAPLQPPPAVAPPPAPAAAGGERWGGAVVTAGDPMPARTVVEHPAAHPRAHPHVSPVAPAPVAMMPAPEVVPATARAHPPAVASLAPAPEMIAAPPPVAGTATPAGAVELTLQVRLSDGAVLTLRESAPLLGAFLRGTPRDEAGMPMVQLTRHPQTGAAGLRNVGRLPWTVVRPGGERAAVAPGGGIVARPGLNVQVSEASFVVL